MRDHSAFLNHVRNYVENNPDVGAHVANFVAEGIQLALSETRHRAADMEVALCMALSKRNKKHADSVILSKLKTWVNKSSINWDQTIKDMSINSPENNTN